MENISYYCVNFLDDFRREKMINRFNKIGIPLQFIPPVYTNDERLPTDTIKTDYRIWSIMLQHLDSINDFYMNSENEYAIICEDDILLSKDLLEDLPNIIIDFEELKLDVLLLGYLLPFSSEEFIDISLEGSEFSLVKKNEKYSYHEFPYHLWGSQMYLINRKHAKFLLDKYTIEYAITNIETSPFNPDWTLTKDGKHLLIYPMLAVEEGVVKTNDIGQYNFHKKCFDINYNPDIYS
jgi:hypothetical protein